MATQNPALNLKGRDGGWEGKQVQSYSCSDCGALVSAPNQMNAWHNYLDQQFADIGQAIQTLNQSIQQVSQQSQNADAQQNQRISALEARP